MKKSRFLLISVLSTLIFTLIFASIAFAQGGTNDEAVTAVETKGAEANQPSKVDHALFGPSVSGVLDNSSPIWDRIFGGAIDVGCNATMTDSSNDGQYYADIAFQVTDSNPITVEVNGAGTSIGDTVIAIYCDPFDATMPMVNVVAYDDDGGAGTLSAFTAVDNISLTVGNTYHLILSTYSGGVAGTYQVDFSDNVVLGTAGAGSLSCGTTVGFDNGIPTDWAVTNNSTITNVFWTNIAGCGEAGNWTGGAGDAACASSDLQNGGSGLYDTEMWSNPFDLTGCRHCHLRLPR